MVERGDIRSTMSLACGRCIGCRLERSRQWSVRVMHEAALYEENCFVTLTFDDAHLPSDISNWYPYFQNFLKRLRRRFYFGKGDARNRVIRFFACAEYGDLGWRPHFHAGLFNIDFRSDRYYWRTTDAGFRLDRSPFLEGLWEFGSVEVGDLSLESAAYIARYALKKVTGDLADDHYAFVHPDTGEVEWRMPECVHMSLKPGIGAVWFSRFQSDVYPHDRCVVRGVEFKPPRFYDKLLKRVDPDMLEELQEVREREARARWPDNTPDRLAVREVVQRARVAFKKRNLK